MSRETGERTNTLMNTDKEPAHGELWNAMHDAVKSWSSGSARGVYEITDAVTAVALSRIALVEKERDMLRAELAKVRARLADELRCKSTDALMDGDPVRDRMAYSLAVTGDDPRTLAVAAYHAVADVLENGEVTR